MGEQEIEGKNETWEYRSGWQEWGSETDEQDVSAIDQYSQGNWFSNLSWIFLSLEFRY